MKARSGKHGGQRCKQERLTSEYIAWGLLYCPIDLVTAGLWVLFWAPPTWDCRWIASQDINLGSMLLGQYLHLALP